MKLYVNRTLNLKKIKYLGLDMDHTLIKYHSEKFEKLAYEKMKEKLIREHSYPAEITHLKFEFKRAIRGLVIDKNRGNLLKVSRYGAIRECYHGLKKIEFKTLKKQFGAQFIDLNDPAYDTIDTTFSISHACLFSQLVELKETKFINEIPDFTQLSEDLQNVLDLSHRDGSIKKVVVQNLDEYIKKDKELVENILKFIKHGKKFFIVTNSDYAYSKILLDYAINPYLSEGKKWSDIFEWVITLSSKPRFFFDKLPILKVDPELGTMENHSGELTPGIYQGGSSADLTDQWGVTGDDILYVGDHIYGDVVRLKKDCEWRTALIIEELDSEVEQNKKSLEISKKIQSFMEEKIKLEDILHEYVAQAIENDLKVDEKKKNEMKKKIETVDKHILPLIEQQRSFHNPYWGEIMRVGIEESQFANQIERFADIYMTDLNDLLSSNPRKYLRSSRRLLPHDFIETIEVE